jgi:hypothetical protein
MGRLVYEQPNYVNNRAGQVVATDRQRNRGQLRLRVPGSSPALATYWCA